MHERQQDKTEMFASYFFYVTHVGRAAEGVRTGSERMFRARGDDATGNGTGVVVIGRFSGHRTCTR